MSGNHDPTTSITRRTAAAHDAPGRYWMNIGSNSITRDTGDGALSTA